MSYWWAIKKIVILFRKGVLKGPKFQNFTYIFCIWKLSYFSFNFNAYFFLCKMTIKIVCYFISKGGAFRNVAYLEGIFNSRNSTRQMPKIQWVQHITVSNTCLCPAIYSRVDSLKWVLQQNWKLPYRNPGPVLGHTQKVIFIPYSVIFSVCSV
jgi:hypothetical protein